MTPLNMLAPMTMTTGFNLMSGRTNLYTPSGVFPQVALCKKVSSLAECVAMGGVMFGSSDDPSNAYIFIGEAMHRIMALNDLRVSIVKTVNLVFGPRSISGGMHDISLNFKYHLNTVPANTKWWYCAVVSKAATGFAASGKKCTLLLTDVRESSYVIGTDYESGAAVHDGTTVDSASVFGALVKMPWQQSLKTSVSSLMTTQMATAGSEGSAALGKAHVAWSAATPDRAMFVNVPVLADQFSGSQHVYMGRNSPPPNSKVLKEIAPDGTNMFMYGPGFYLDGAGFMTPPWPRTDLASHPTGVTVSDTVASTSRVVYTPQPYGCPIEVQGQNFLLPLFGSACVFMSGNNAPLGRPVARPAIWNGPLKSIDGVDIGGWFAPCIPLLYYNAAGVKDLTSALAILSSAFQGLPASEFLRSAVRVNQGATVPQDVQSTDSVAMKPTSEQWPDDYVSVLTGAMDDIYSRAEALV